MDFFQCPGQVLIPERYGYFSLQDLVNVPIIKQLHFVRHVPLVRNDCHRCTILHHTLGTIAATEAGTYITRFFFLCMSLDTRFLQKWMYSFLVPGPVIAESIYWSKVPLQWISMTSQLLITKIHIMKTNTEYLASMFYNTVIPGKQVTRDPNVDIKYFYFPFHVLGMAYFFKKGHQGSFPKGSISRPQRWFSPTLPL